MAKAKRKTTTLPAPDPAVPQFTDPVTLPDHYVMTCDGDCMKPAIPDGAAIAFSKLEAPIAGDYVILWRRPEKVPPGQHQATIKRLVHNLPHFVRWPHRDHPESEVIAALVVERLNPPGRQRWPAPPSSPCTRRSGSAQRTAA